MVQRRLAIPPAINADEVFGTHGTVIHEYALTSHQYRA